MPDPMTPTHREQARERDARLHQKLHPRHNVERWGLEWRYCPDLHEKGAACDFTRIVPAYSTNPAAMLALLEAMTARGYWWMITCDRANLIDALFWTGEGAGRREWLAMSDTPMEAVARAVLAALEGV